MDQNEEALKKRQMFRNIDAAIESCDSEIENYDKGLNFGKTPRPEHMLEKEAELKGPVFKPEGLKLKPELVLKLEKKKKKLKKLRSELDKWFKTLEKFKSIISKLGAKGSKSPRLRQMAEKLDSILANLEAKFNPDEDIPDSDIDSLSKDLSKVDEELEKVERELNRPQFQEEIKNDKDYMDYMEEFVDNAAGFLLDNLEKLNPFSAPKPEPTAEVNEPDGNENNKEQHYYEKKAQSTYGVEEDMNTEFSQSADQKIAGDLGTGDAYKKGLSFSGFNEIFKNQYDKANQPKEQAKTEHNEEKRDISRHPGFIDPTDGMRLTREDKDKK